MNDPEPGQGLTSLPDDLLTATDEPTTIAMDQWVDKLAEAAECQRSITFWQKRLEKIKTELAELVGDAQIGTVNGSPVFAFAWKDQFNSTEFKKKYPDMYRLYSRDVTEKKFDAEWLKSTRPELWHQFQVRAMRITFDA